MKNPTGRKEGKKSMGITPITDAKGLLDQLTATVTAPKVPDGSSQDFRSVWNDQAASANAVNADTKVAAPAEKNTEDLNAKPDNAPKAEKNGKADGPGDEGKASKTDVKGKDSPEETVSETVNENGDLLKDEEIVSAQEVLSSIVEELAVKIAEILNIKPEELEGLLEESGFVMSDLLDKDNMSAFLLNALGADSQVSLLTDEEGYEVFSEAMDVLTQTLESRTEFGEMTVSDLKDAVEQVVQSAPEVTAADNEMSAVGEEVKAPAPVHEETVRYVRNSDGDLEKVDVNETGSEVGEASIVNKAVKPAENNKQSGQETENDEQQSEMHQDIKMQDAFTQEHTAPVQETPVTYSSVQTQEIADQILEHMKTVTDGDFSDVEMQLHPASLGTVHVHVTNNAGVITASFVTENEAVRTAVESQIVRLAEQFEAQGIKVDAVEVTVASRSFEGNLDSNTENSQERSENGTKKTRRINLDDEELDTSSLEDDERIAAEMMAANGNRVDYTA